MENIGITGYVNIYNTLDTDCSGTNSILTIDYGIAIQKIYVLAELMEVKKKIDGKQGLLLRN